MISNKEKPSPVIIMRKNLIPLCLSFKDLYLACIIYIPNENLWQMNRQALPSFQFKGVFDFSSRNTFP